VAGKEPEGIPGRELRYRQVIASKPQYEILACVAVPSPYPGGLANAVDALKYRNKTAKILEYIIVLRCSNNVKIIYFGFMWQLN
jgi:hypothetical protein